MEHNGKDEIMVQETGGSQCSSSMISINIKTMDSLTYTIQVDRAVPIIELKEKIASVTGVVTEQQRLFCSGRVLQDDQLLSAYHVEDGHTLHLVVRQPIVPLPETSTSDAGDDPALSAGERQGIQRPRVVTHFSRQTVRTAHSTATINIQIRIRSDGSSSPPRGRGLSRSVLRNIMRQLLRPSSRRRHIHVPRVESQQIMSSSSLNEAADGGNNSSRQSSSSEEEEDAEQGDSTQLPP